MRENERTSKSRARHIEKFQGPMNERGMDDHGLDPLTSRFVRLRRTRSAAEAISTGTWDFLTR
jgi:hypothetical protein